MLFTKFYFKQAILLVVFIMKRTLKYEKKRGDSLMLDFIIKNGQVIDPANKVNEVKTIGVKNGKIVPVSDDAKAKNIIDAAGHYVMPGLIDSHAHAFCTGSGLGVQPDLQAATGVTTVIDAGTAGWSNYSAFHNTTVVNSLVKVKSLIGYNQSGQVELGYMENYKKESINVDKVRRIFDKYPEYLVGMKMRFQKEVTGDTGIKYLKEMIELADEIGCSVTVHTTNPPVPASEIADILRAGDVYCHCFQGVGHTIVDENGKVYDAVKKARERGVLFDAANGTGNFAFSCAIPALADGFLPDMISADNACNSFGLDLYARNLPFVMSKYLTLGMQLEDIVACATSNPAKYLKMQDEIGTLKEGACADITIMSWKKKKQEFWDSVKNPSTAIFGEDILVPQMTMIDGAVVHRNNDF